MVEAIRETSFPLLLLLLSRESRCGGTGMLHDSCPGHLGMGRVTYFVDESFLGCPLFGHMVGGAFESVALLPVDWGGDS